MCSSDLKFHEAKVRGDRTVTVWGTGSSLREFLYSDDMADACVYLAELPDTQLTPLLNDRLPPLVNVGCGEDLSIRELAAMIRTAVGSKADLTWDTSKPNGTPRKLLDVSLIAGLGWRANTSLEHGLALAYADFLAQNASQC